MLFWPKFDNVASRALFVFEIIQQEIRGDVIFSQTSCLQWIRIPILDSA